MGHFLDASSFYFKARLRAEKPSTWKWFFVLVQVTLIFTTKFFALSLVLKERVLELGNGLFSTQGDYSWILGELGLIPWEWREKDRRRYTRKPAVSLLIGSVNLVVVADCLVFRLLIFHFKFYFLTTLKSNIFSFFHNF